MTPFGDSVMTNSYFTHDSMEVPDDDRDGEHARPLPRRRPTNLTLAGGTLAIAGIMLVLGVFESGFSGAHINVTGVIWALAAAICAACYFMMSDEVAADGTGLNSITLAAGGLIVGSVA